MKKRLPEELVTPENIARLRVLETGETELGHCHNNSITLLFRETFRKNFDVCQMLIKAKILRGGNKEDPLYTEAFHSHSVLVHKDRSIVVEARFQEQKIPAFNIDLYQKLVWIRRPVFFDSERALYWVRKTNNFGPFDPFHRKVEKNEGVYDEVLLKEPDIDLRVCK